VTNSPNKVFPSAVEFFVGMTAKKGSQTFECPAIERARRRHFQRKIHDLCTLTLRLRLQCDITKGNVRHQRVRAFPYLSSILQSFQSRRTDPLARVIDRGGLMKCGGAVIPRFCGNGIPRSPF